MSIKLLNIIIVFSLAGLISVGVKDFISPKKPEVITTPIITPSVIYTNQEYIPQLVTQTGSSDPIAYCTNKFFNFNPGVKWQYKIKGQIENMQEGKEIQQIDETFTNTLENNASYSATIKTKFQKTGTEKTSTMNCRNSGIYGFPLPIFNDLASSTAASGQLSILKNIQLQPLLFLPPDDKLQQGQSWNTDLGINTGFDISLDSLGVGLINTVTKEEKVTYQGRVITQLTIESKLNSPLPLNFFGSSDLIKIKSVLLEGIGIKDFEFSIQLKDVTSSAIKLSLLKFTP